MRQNRSEKLASYIIKARDSPIDPYVSSFIRHDCIIYYVSGFSGSPVASISVISVVLLGTERVIIALRRFLQNIGNIATEESPQSGIGPTVIE